MTNWANKPLGQFPMQFFAAIRQDSGGEIGFGLQHRSMKSVRNQWWAFLQQLRAIKDHPYHARGMIKWRLHAGAWEQEWRWIVKKAKD